MRRWLLVGLCSLVFAPTLRGQGTENAEARVNAQRDELARISKEDLALKWKSLQSFIDQREKRTAQVLHEKDEPAPGLTVDTIRQNDVVLRYKGYRYSVGY